MLFLTHGFRTLNLETWWTQDAYSLHRCSNKSGGLTFLVRISAGNGQHPFVDEYPMIFHMCRGQNVVCLPIEGDGYPASQIKFNNMYTYIYIYIRMMTITHHNPFSYNIIHIYNLTMADIFSREEPWQASCSWHRRGWCPGQIWLGSSGMLRIWGEI